MENKYYTPEIAEFHEGFRYEYNYKELGWVSDIFTVGSGDTDCMAGEWYEFAPSNPNTKTRVKFLDKEDIESFGWRFSNITKDSASTKWTIDIKGKEVAIWLIFRDKIQIVDCRSEIHHVLFYGEIKNKSEFGKLMKQLNII